MAKLRLKTIPLTLARAQRMVVKWHRHHPPIPTGMAMWCLGCVANGRLVGIAIVGRPVNRVNDDLQTAEVLRVATDGTRNASSHLLGACRRVAATAGFARIITYTLESESGASLRGAGWNREKDGIRSGWASDVPSNYRKGRGFRHHDHLKQTKVRWGVAIRKRIDVDLSETDPQKSNHDKRQTLLFTKAKQ